MSLQRKRRRWTHATSASLAGSSRTSLKLRPEVTKVRRLANLVRHRGRRRVIFVNNLTRPWLRSNRSVLGQDLSCFKSCGGGRVRVMRAEYLYHCVKLKEEK